MWLNFIYFYSLFYTLNTTLQEDAIARYEKTKYLLPFLLNTTNDVAQLSEVGQHIKRAQDLGVAPCAVLALKSLELELLETISSTGTSNYHVRLWLIEMLGEINVLLPFGFRSEGLKMALFW